MEILNWRKLRFDEFTRSILTLSSLESSFLLSFFSSSFSSYRKQLTLVTKKPVFGTFDQVRLKQVCSAAETS